MTVPFVRNGHHVGGALTVGCDKGIYFECWTLEHFSAGIRVMRAVREEMTGMLNAKAKSCNSLTLSMYRGGYWWNQK